MATAEPTTPRSLAPPSIAALRAEDARDRTPMLRTPSMDMRAERDDLQTAAEQSLNIILDLSLDGHIRWVSQSWKDVVGTLPEAVKGQPIGSLLLPPHDVFANAIEAMKGDDSKSRLIRFRMNMGPHSILRKIARDANRGDRSPGTPTPGESKTTSPISQEQIDENAENADADKSEEKEQVLTLKGQGIMVSNRITHEDSHTMWMLRPSTQPIEITIDLPEILVDSLGVGAEMLAQHLTMLAGTECTDPVSLPPPPPIMCRICERQIPNWWFQKHTEGCTQEYRAESEVTLAQEALTEHRPAIVKVLDALDPEMRQDRSPVSGDTTVAAPVKAEYKGLMIGTATPSPPATDGMRSNLAIAGRSRDSSISAGSGSSRSGSSSMGHSRTRSFAVRRPLSKIVTLLVDLCDTALDISMPSVKVSPEDAGEHFRCQSPQSESRISQVLGWQTPSVATSEEEQGLARLIRDTEHLASAKVDAVLRHREILDYTERIRAEFHALVLDCIDAAIKKASSIKAGQLSDSSSDSGREDEAQPEESELSRVVSVTDAMQNVMISESPQRRCSESPSITSQFDGRPASIAASSTRSSSPMECPTPRSHLFGGGSLSRSGSVNKRGSLLFESDTADSDTGMSRSVMLTSRRTESPEISNRSASSGDRKRRSLKLPTMPSPHRQPSPARISATPQSPLRITKPRMPASIDSMPSLPSPVISPPLSSIEPNSPLVTGHRHRRQSSAASSMADSMRPPGSPRLGSVSQPPSRALPTSIKDFEIIKPISKGAFGSVYLSKKKSTGDHFAIKVLRKADMVAKNQVTNVKAERAIMMWQGESEFVAKLYWTFSSKDYLFLVMEYLNGGDCASLVKVLGGLPEDWSKKYVAEVILGVEHLHSRGIVHRDLKPDNLLIDQKGHLKLTDFGLSRMGLIGRQKRALKSPNDPTPDLLRTGGFTRSTSMASSRSTSFDYQGAASNNSPHTTPMMTPDLAGSLGQPSYFSLNRETVLGREHSRRKSGYRSDSGNSDTFSTMFRNFSLNDEGSQRGASIEEETQSDGGGSPDSYALRTTISSQSQNQPDTPPQPSMLPPPMALFDPEDQNRRFVGTPDYLAPETINGLGQDEMSDWWSLGCIMFEFLYGYPPFHGETPEIVFENILTRKIHWPDDSDCPVSAEAKDVMERLMTIDPKQRLGSNIAEKFSSGGDEIRQHAWFDGLNWETLLEDEASFIPAPENAEDTEYFDARGATLQTFTEEMEEQASSPVITPSNEYLDRPHDALSRVRSQVNSMKRGLMPLHIPPHVRDSRTRRLSEPVANDDFGNFAFKNLPVLEKANKELLQKMRVEAANKQVKTTTTNPSSTTSTTGPSLEGSPLLPMPLHRTLSASKGNRRPASPSSVTQVAASPSRTSQPSSPLVSFSTGQGHERRKTSSSSSSLSLQTTHGLQPGNFFEPPRLPTSQTTGSVSVASSPIKSSRHSLNMLVSSSEKAPPTSSSRPQSMYMPITSRARSQTVGSQEDAMPPSRPISHHKRQSQVFDVSPSSSDNEDPRAKALLRVQRRRQSSRRLSQIILTEGPTFRPLDVLICEDHPVSRLVMERLLEKLKCRTITVVNGSEAARYAMSEVQFDIIMMEFRLPHINGADVARMIRDTKSANTHTPIIAVTGYLKELPQAHHFDALIEKPATMEKITDTLTNLCQWKPAPVGYSASQQSAPPMSMNMPSSLRKESRRAEESPSSSASGPFSHIPGLRKRSSREHSIGSSFFGDTDSTNTEDIPMIVGRHSDDWAPTKGLGISETPPQTSTQVSSGTTTPHPSSHGSSIHLHQPQAENQSAHAPLIHQNSAPPDLDIRVPRKQLSAEAVKAKREEVQRHRHGYTSSSTGADSGDDEDEELGNNHHVRDNKAPQHRNSSAGHNNKHHRTSKLGIEMMRTNSRGSIDEQVSSPDEGRHHSLSPPPLPPNPNPREYRADQIAAVVAGAGIGIGTSTTSHPTFTRGSNPTHAPQHQPKEREKVTPPMQQDRDPDDDNDDKSQEKAELLTTPPEVFSKDDAKDKVIVQAQGDSDLDITPRPNTFMTDVKDAASVNATPVASRVAIVSDVVKPSTDAKAKTVAEADENEEEEGGDDGDGDIGLPIQHT